MPLNIQHWKNIQLDIHEISMYRNLHLLSSNLPSVPGVFPPGTAPCWRWKNASIARRSQGVDVRLFSLFWSISKEETWGFDPEKYEKTVFLWTYGWFNLIYCWFDDGEVGVGVDGRRIELVNRCQWHIQRSGVNRQVWCLDPKSIPWHNLAFPCQACAVSLCDLCFLFWTLRSNPKSNIFWTTQHFINSHHNHKDRPPSSDVLEPFFARQVFVSLFLVASLAALGSVFKARNASVGWVENVGCWLSMIVLKRYTTLVLNWFTIITEVEYIFSNT